MDLAIESTKPFGLYQLLTTLLLGSVTSMAALHFYVTVFNMAEPAFKCQNRLVSMNESNISLSETQCTMWNNFSTMGNDSQYVCEFNDKYYNLTLINDWGLICGKHYMASLTQTVFFFGSICTFMNGFISDKFGRKPTITIFLLVQLLSTVINQLFVVGPTLVELDVFVKYVIYCVHQFVTGLLVFSSYACSYMLAVEFTTDDYHTLVANVVLFFFILGECFLLAVFYVTRNWIATNWFITIFTFFVTVLCAFGITESPR